MYAQCIALDKSGNIAIPCIYDLASMFIDGLSAIQKDGKYGYMDTSGNIVIPCVYESG
ncbi:WG repeat-containing protein [Paenibacillus mendelii]|uniref:WG repeat-containing protein n=1 Tax=Paenibacillus mendelii TaxID=206163 RepID=UPI001956BD2D